MILELILAVIQIAFLVLSFVGNSRSWIGPDPYALFVLISANLAVLMIWLGVKAGVSKHWVRQRFGDVTTALKDHSKSHPGVLTLVDHDFYLRFGKAMRDATVGVAVTHLDTYAPNRNKKTPAAEYYAGFSKTIKSNTRTSFRRVERASREKLEWLRSLITTFDGVGNFSLGVLLLPSEQRRTGLVSVQLVDDSDVALVAVAEHDSSLGVRDIWINDRATADLWRHYFEDVLWKPSARVMENGHLNQSEWQRCLDFIQNHE